MSERPAGPPDEPPAKGEADRRRRLLSIWLWRLPVLAVLAGGIWGVQRAVRIQFGKVQPTATPSFRPAAATRVAPLAEFAEPWSAAEFTIDGIPALALRLPQPIPGGTTVDGVHLAAFSRVCTHLGCITVLNREEEAIAVAFNYRTPHPALTCGCHLSVFLPLQAGLAASGPAVEPLPRIALELLEGDVYAVGVEQTPSS